MRVGSRNGLSRDEIARLGVLRLEDEDGSRDWLAGNASGTLALLATLTLSAAPRLTRVNSLTPLKRV